MELLVLKILAMSVKKLNFLFIKCMLYFLFVTVSSDNNDNNKKKYGRGSLISSPLYLGEVPDVIPESFDAREKWPQCPSIKTVEDQGDCNSLTVATAWTITDRWCISSNGSDQFEFSAADLLTCSSLDLTRLNATFYGCEILSFEFVLDNWIDKGVVSGSGQGRMEGCKPYSTIVQKDGVSATAEECKEECTNPDYKIPYNKDKRFGVNYRTLSFNFIENSFNYCEAEKDVQTEIMNYGPVLTTIDSTKDFVENGGRGIYRVPKEEPENSEITKVVVKIIGWGTEDGKPYWLLANTRGPKWGAEKGFFKLLRGRNHMGIQERVYMLYVKKGQYTNEDSPERPSTHSPRHQFSAASILNSIITAYFMIFNMFMYLYL